MVKLRPGPASSDGTPLTAELAIQLLAGAQAAGKPLGLRAVDPLTIEIRFPEAFAPGLRVLDQVSAARVRAVRREGERDVRAQSALLAQGGGRILASLSG